jgi:hypothetical protein
LDGDYLLVNAVQPVTFGDYQWAMLFGIAMRYIEVLSKFLPLLR